MDRRELEIMLNDAFDRGIVTARAVEGIYPPAVTVGILDDLGREIDFGHEGSGLTVFLPGIEDDARFAGSCKALGGKVPQNTYRMELVSAIAGELMGAESATALSALESALDRARRRGYCVFDRGIHDDVLLASIYFLPFRPTYFHQSRRHCFADRANADAPLPASPCPPSRRRRRATRLSGGRIARLSL